MQNKFYNFLSSKFIAWFAPILFLATSLAYDIYYMFDVSFKYGTYYVVCDAFIAILFLIVTISFKKHEKNVTKMMLAGLLAIPCLNTLYGASGNIFYYNDIFYDIFSAIFALSYVALLVMHLLLASKHKPSFALINGSVIVAIIAFIVDVAWYIYDIVAFQSNVVYCILVLLSVPPFFLLLLNVEIKVNYFKALREKREEEEAALAEVFAQVDDEDEDDE